MPYIQANRANFYSSRAAGGLRARRGDVVYLTPPDVLANVISQQKLYFGLATYRENSKGTPDFVQAPSVDNMHVNLSVLTARGLRRLMSSSHSSGCKVETRRSVEGRLLFQAARPGIAKSPQ